MMVLYSVQGWNLIFGWLEFGWGPNLVRVSSLALFGALAASTSRRFHLAGSIIYLLLLIWFVVRYTPSLSNALTAAGS
jgi:hypothetical protein